MVGFPLQTRFPVHTAYYEPRAIDPHNPLVSAMLRAKEVLLTVLPLLLFAILIPACTNDLPVDSVEDEVQSLLVTVEVQEQGSFSWSQSLSGDRARTSAFIESLETIIPQFQKQVPVSATVRVRKGDEVIDLIRNKGCIGLCGVSCPFVLYYLKTNPLQEVLTAA